MEFEDLVWTPKIIKIIGINETVYLEAPIVLTGLMAFLYNDPQSLTYLF